MKDVISKIFKSNYNKQHKAFLEAQKEDETANKNEFGFNGSVKLKSLKVKFLQVKKEKALINLSKTELEARNLNNQFVWTDDTRQLFWISRELEIFKLNFSKV